MITQYAIRITNEIDDTIFESLAEIVSEDRKKRIKKFMFQADKVRCLFAEVLLRYALWNRYGMKGEQIRFTYNEYGKPSLEGKEDIFFNLTHSGDWVLCGIGDFSLGVDVETIKENRLDLAERFFTKQEYQDILNQQEEKQKQYFTELWTLKESYSKAVGKGLSIPLDSFSFHKKEEEIQLFIEGKKEDSWCFALNFPDENHCAAICVSKGHNLEQESILSEMKKIEQVNLQELILFSSI